MKIETANLYLAGWSQGGFVTMAFLEKLEADGVKVTAAATASAPVDIFMALNGFLNFPRKIDATWVNTLFILSAFAYENYYAVPGLARSLFTDATYEVARKVYEREPVEAADIPTDLHALIRADYFDPQFFAASAYGRLLAANHAYRWVIETPVRNYYGDRGRGDQHRPRPAGDDLAAGDGRRQRQGRGHLDRPDQPPRHLRHRHGGVEGLVRRDSTEPAATEPGTPPSIAGEALLLPGVAVDVVAAELPEAGLVDAW